MDEAEEGAAALQGEKATMSAEDPAAAAPRVPPHGNIMSHSHPAQFDGAVLALPAFLGGEEEASVLGDEEEEFAHAPGASYGGEEAEAYAMDGGSDSDSEFEAHDDEGVRFWDSDAPGSRDDLVAGPLTFLGRLTRFASFQGTAGFMRLATAVAPPGLPDGGGGGVIVVHYRYTHFSVAPSGGASVAARNYGTRLHHVRYVVPSFPTVVANPAAALRLVGAALAADVYPYGSYERLQALWSGLVAAGAPVRVPPRATRLVVTVDVGMLRAEDRTPDRVACMRSALAVLAREVDSSRVMAAGLEELLPAPVCRRDVSGETDRLAKKRRRFGDVEEEEVCAICHEGLERGLATWPRCSHVFHGKCLEQLLVTAPHRCPLCRSTLSIKGTFG